MPVARVDAPRRWDIGARAIWTIELFDRLERRDRLGVTRPWDRSDAISKEVAC
jgi:hypothetical protein